MESKFLADLEGLTMAQKTLLAKGKLQTVSDLLLKPPSDLAKKCKMPLKEMDALIDTVCRELAPQPRTLREIGHIGEEKFTTGDPHIDDVLGGGVRTGMLWEFAGENNAGKSRLAMQLALTVQLPQKLGGVSGAACYVTTREELITPILEGMITDNPLLSPALCGLPDIYTVNAPFFPAVLKVLTESLPTFADERARTLGAKPVKLLVIDTFSDIFDQDKHPEYEDKIHRARDIRRVSLVMHRLASKYNLAVVALGAAKGTRPRFEGGDTGPGELRYSDQERWFARAYSLPGEDANEAILGHVWPNQLNARIMMSRTIRTRPRSAVDPRAQAQGQPPAKRRKVDVDPGRAAGDVDDPSVPLRRFSVIFSSVGPPASCDYVIFDEGVVGIPVEEPPPSTCIYPTPPSSSPGQDGASVPAAQSSGYETAISGWILSTPGAIGSSSESNVQQTRSRESLSYAPASEAATRPPLSTQSASGIQRPRSRQSLSYASFSTPPTPAPQRSTIPSASSMAPPSAPPSAVPATIDSQQPRSVPCAGFSMLSMSASAAQPSKVSSSSMHGLPSAAPLAPTQSTVPSSQPELDEDWDMYWKDSQQDEHLYASVAEDPEGPREVEEAAEDGPPAEKDGTDSDYYWEEGGDDALYADL